jgi:hypothetical protein
VKGANHYPVWRPFYAFDLNAWLYTGACKN